MKIRGVSIDILCYIDPIYQDYMKIENQRKMLMLQKQFMDYLNRPCYFTEDFQRMLFNFDSRSTLMTLALQISKWMTHR
jgi:hypothetical protein